MRTLRITIKGELIQKTEPNRRSVQVQCAINRHATDMRRRCIIFCYPLVHLI